jgi:mono/diheme cytochrome c family protein
MKRFVITPSWGARVRTLALTLWSAVHARPGRTLVLTLAAGCGATLLIVACNNDNGPTEPRLDPTMVAQGKDIFRFDTFGDETFWTDSLRLHEVVESAVDPTTALAVGLKVDTDSLPPAVVQGIQNGTISLTSPATTVALLKLNAVVGVKGTVETVGGKETLTRIGITCALCHSTVDNSFARGIGKRLDGWPNHDLDVGAIVALSPALPASAKAVYSSWGKGKYDPRFNFDGKNGPQVIPPAYGLLGIHSITVTGDGSDVAYWNRYVGVTQMHGHGTFSEPRTGVSVNNTPPDLVSSKLPALQAYQLSLSAPPPPAASFDPAAAARGQQVFEGPGQCATCHTGALLTDANTRLHAPSEVVSEPEPNGAPSYASRSATKMYRTAPLHGLWQHPPYFHNGVAPTLDAVVTLYDTRKGLNLTPQQKADLVQYLKSL